MKISYHKIGKSDILPFLFYGLSNNISGDSKLITGCELLISCLITKHTASEIN